MQYVCTYGKDRNVNLYNQKSNMLNMMPTIYSSIKDELFNTESPTNYKLAGSVILTIRAPIVWRRKKMEEIKGPSVLPPCFSQSGAANWH